MAALGGLGLLGLGAIASFFSPGRQSGYFIEPHLGYISLMVLVAFAGTGLIAYWLAGNNVGGCLRAALVIFILLVAVGIYLGLACAGIVRRPHEVLVPR